MGWGQPNGQRDPLLTGVKLKVEKGQRVLVLGPNGAGKTTLLKVISGQLTWLCSDVLQLFHIVTFARDFALHALLLTHVDCIEHNLQFCPVSVSHAPLMYPSCIPVAPPSCSPPPYPFAPVMCPSCITLRQPLCYPHKPQPIICCCYFARMTCNSRFFGLNAMSSKSAELCHCTWRTCILPLRMHAI